MPKSKKTKNSKATENRAKSSKTITILIILLAFSLILLIVLSKYYGTTDVKDYVDVAKYFSGNYQAKIRTSHSYLYGIMFAPLVKLFKNFFMMKIASILWLVLLVISIYYISNRNKKTLFLILVAPVLWYMSPWISPIPLSSLLFLWGYFFIKKYEDKGKIRNLLFSGLFLGLAWAFWDGAFYFSFLLAVSFLYNKKLTHCFYFLIFLLIGVAPRLFLEQLLFNFAFFGILRHFFASLVFTLYGGIYGQGHIYSIKSTILVLLFIPFYSYLLASKKIFIKYKKTILFLILSFILLILNPQIRLTLMIVPIILLMLGENLNERKFKIQIIIFLILSLLVIEPYLLQIKYEINNEEFSSFITNFLNLQLNKTFSNKLILQDLEDIAKEYPQEIFVVGNGRDDYRTLAHLYWDKDIKELVSIEDYQLYLKNETSIISKTLCSESKIKERRDICFSIELRKAVNDETDYNSIRYAISLDNNLTLENFKLIKKYQILSVYFKNDTIS